MTADERLLPQAYWSVDGDALYHALGSGRDGLSPDEARARLRSAGRNEISARRAAGRLEIFFRQFKSPIVLILLFAVAISFGLRHWSDAGIILAIIFGSALLSFRQEYRAGEEVQKLQARISLRATVVRGGTTVTIPAAEIVPGDIVLLSAGTLIPADGIVVEARDFFLNQAELTGETFPVERKPGPVAAETPLGGRTNCVYLGTNVRSGTARALVTGTGSATEFGRIAQRLRLRPPMTAFEHGIQRLGFLLTEVTLILVLAVFAINVAFHRPVLDSLLFSLALAVGLTPQLLPAIINITLSRGSIRMARHGVIVRRLESIEEFGGMDVLCTDKTGTITEGTVRLDRAVDPAGLPSEETLRLAAWNARFQTGLQNPLDEAILAASASREEPGTTGSGDVQKLDEIPYDFHRKCLSVVVSHDAQPLLVMKGAVANVLSKCSRILENGEEVPLRSPRLEALNQAYLEWSGQGIRTLAIATKAVPGRDVYGRDEETEMTFRGFLLFLDPPKAGVRETLADLKSLGVEVKIITGDNMLVAKHTAEAIGLPTTEILTGSDLDRMRDEALWNAADRASIFAEIEPNQKERIILALRKMGRVVGYMGDGINDAPALHAANLGISVEQAVDVAKEAADFVLLSKDLRVLHEGILEGRTTFANTLKYVFMATSANFGNMFSMAGASLFLPFLPMLPKQILLINLLTDLPEMAIAGDRVDPEFLERPHRWDVGFVRRFMLVFGSLSSLFDFLTFGVLVAVLHAGQAQFHTGWFVESVVSATLIIFAVRSRLPFHRSRPSRTMALIALAVVLATLLLPYSPLARPLGFAPVPLAIQASIAGIVVLYFLAAEGVKRLFYRRELGAPPRSV